MRKKSFPDQLFTEALKNENSGRFEEALATYKIALAEIKKRKHRSNLENMIIEKIKVLDTNIEYNNDIRLNPSAEGG